jgi:hypothetical protein
VFDRIGRTLARLYQYNDIHTPAADPGTIVVHAERQESNSVARKHTQVVDCHGLIVYVFYTFDSCGFRVKIKNAY